MNSCAAGYTHLRLVRRASASPLRAHLLCHPLHGVRDDLRPFHVDTVAGSPHDDVRPAEGRLVTSSISCTSKQRGSNPAKFQRRCDRAMNDQHITLINVFTVPVEESERFLDSWRHRADAMARQPGFMGATMYGALHDETELRFINVAEWATEDALERALAMTGLPAHARPMLGNMHITSRPAVYRAEVRLSPAGGHSPPDPARG